jgi:lipoprotein-releasing system permease protein
MISIVGVAFSTMAMVVVLSAFNGIEGIVESLYNSFDADIKITLAEGKTFNPNLIDKNKLSQIEGVEIICPVIEETALFKKDDRFVTAKLKGVDDSYIELINLDTLLTEGLAEFSFGGTQYCIPGLIIQSRLGVSSDPRYENTITVHGMLRTKRISVQSQPFNKRNITVGGAFVTNTPYDEKYVLTSLAFARELLEYGEEVTAIEIGIKPAWKKSEDRVKKDIQKLIGKDFRVKTRMEENQLIFSATKNEKIATYIILCFVLFIAAFTLIASLTMLILEKRKDVFTLYSFGFTKESIERLFFYEGILINIIGGLIGIGLGVLICYLQIWFQFIPMEGMIIEAYPVEVEILDILYIIITVLIVGFISSYFPVKYLIKRLEI